MSVDGGHDDTRDGRHLRQLHRVGTLQVGSWYPVEYFDGKLAELVIYEPSP